MYEDTQLSYKIVVVGDPSVGKTSILYSYIYGVFQEALSVTTACDFQIKLFHDPVYQKEIKLQLWDIAGGERYKSITKIYIRGAVGCLIVTDITQSINDQQKSILHWKKIISDCEQQLNQEKMPIILVQNKTDKVDQAHKQESFELMKKWSVQEEFTDFIQTSAKQNENLNQIFVTMVSKIFEMRLNLYPDYKGILLKQSILNNNNKQNQRNCKC